MKFIKNTTLVALLSSAGFSTYAAAQTVPASSTDASTVAVATTGPTEPAPGDIVVTGSRIARQGFEQPTPTTVLGSDLLEARAPATLADAVNLLPALASSSTPRSVNNAIGGGTGGANLLNLRGLGVSRTLVLLDGHRVVPSTTTGAVDINLLPSSLIQRTEVVTGGASAAYGSDAVAGVVNFILDDRFTGFKASVQNGVTQAGDGASHRVEAAYGGTFLGDRLHILASASYEQLKAAGPASSRSWFKGDKVVTNPAFLGDNTQPARAVLPGVGLSNATAGGLITAGPLRGTEFLPGGVPAPFNFGVVTGQLSYGGSATDEAAYNQLQTPLKNATAYGRASYDITDEIQLYADFLYGLSFTRYDTVPYFRLGNITISQDNAYLDSATRARLMAAGATSFVMGSTNRDLGVVQGVNRRQLERYNGGLKGTVSGFKFDVYYQHGSTDIENRADNDAIVANYNRSVDAVRNAAGQIVCRSTVANPADGCVPLNIFGGTSASAAAAAYINGSARQDISIKQDVVDASITGDLFRLPAGPVSIALGGEYRHEKYDATADALSLTNGYFVGNYKPSSGTIGVKEGFVEFVVPFLKDVAFFKRLDLNAAGRITDYTTSGTVETWKVGATWDITSDLRLRGTRSRDIRAPNLNDLYQGGQSTAIAVTDAQTNSSYFTQQLVVGNPNLKPEKADTYTIGAVLHPHWFAGFTASVDYFNIKINDAIVTLAPQTLLNGCLAGGTAFCQYVTRNAAGAITQIQTPGLNASSEKTSGIDFELRYRTRLGPVPGSLSLGALATWTDKRTVQILTVVRDYAGTLSDTTAVPRWRGLSTVTYDVGGFSTIVTGRYIGSGILSDLFKNNGIIDNHVPATFYLDWAVSQKVRARGTDFEVFLAIDNLLNQEPRVTPATIGNTMTTSDTNPLIYDTLGRAFRAGARIKF